MRNQKDWYPIDNSSLWYEFEGLMISQAEQPSGTAVTGWVWPMTTIILVPKIILTEQSYHIFHSHHHQLFNITSIEIIIRDPYCVSPYSTYRYQCLFFSQQVVMIFIHSVFVLRCLISIDINIMIKLIFVIIITIIISSWHYIHHWSIILMIGWAWSRVVAITSRCKKEPQPQQRTLWRAWYFPSFLCLCCQMWYCNFSLPCPTPSFKQ